jgi:hypothetical protein
MLHAAAIPVAKQCITQSDIVIPQFHVLNRFISASVVLVDTQSNFNLTRQEKNPVLLLAIQYHFTE